MIESWWGRDFPHPSRPALGTPSLLYNGYLVFPGGKERGVDYPTPSTADVKERVELYLCFPSRPLWPVLGWPYLYLYPSPALQLELEPESNNSPSFVWQLTTFIPRPLHLTCRVHKRTTKSGHLSVSLRTGAPLLPTVWLAHTSGWTPVSTADNYGGVRIRNVPVWHIRARWSTRIRTKSLAVSDSPMKLMYTWPVAGMSVHLIQFQVRT